MKLTRAVRVVRVTNHRTRESIRRLEKRAHLAAQQKQQCPVTLTTLTTQAQPVRLGAGATGAEHPARSLRTPAGDARPRSLGCDRRG